MNESERIDKIRRGVELIQDNANMILLEIYRLKQELKRETE